MPAWLELAKDAFYLIGSALLQHREHHWVTKVKHDFYVSFFKMLARLTRF
jgi:hypothetical protein